ncbi:hypothetical protein TNIN_155541 [Trichonephila inaurata madagascariensis]|uniref:Uncharacterized protein n=1 Tax=Trichonephila inaurata madagascariensis TaxID=2747483 RepID=A0A8X6YWZ9_9ARAC|nr:hypothetical protein TNIN_155541 [Trichonephila inaurata madagascariensis]
MKLEENLAEDIENLLPSFKEEKDTKSLININTDEFIKAQQKSEELAPLIQKVEKGMNNEASDYSLTKGKHLIKSRKNKNGDIRQLLVIPEKFRSSILKMGHEGHHTEGTEMPLMFDTMGFMVFHKTNSCFFLLQHMNLLQQYHASCTSFTSSSTLTSLHCNIRCCFSLGLFVQFCKVARRRRGG